MNKYDILKHLEREIKLLDSHYDSLLSKSEFLAFELPKIIEEDSYLNCRIIDNCNSLYRDMDTLSPERLKEIYDDMRDGIDLLYKLTTDFEHYQEKNEENIRGFINNIYKIIG